jgi:arginyl-tRNA synthetase
MNPFAHFTERVREAVADLSKSGAIKPVADTSRVVVEPPRDASHGDLATNAAMVLAKDAGKNPRELAILIAQKLLSVPHVTKPRSRAPASSTFRSNRCSGSTFCVPR